MTDQEVIDSQDNAEKELIKSAFNKAFSFAGFTEGQTIRFGYLAPCPLMKSDAGLTQTLIYPCGLLIYEQLHFK